MPADNIERGQVWTNTATRLLVTVEEVRSTATGAIFIAYRATHDPTQQVMSDNIGVFRRVCTWVSDPPRSLDTDGVVELSERRFRENYCDYGSGPIELGSLWRRRGSPERPVRVIEVNIQMGRAYAVTYVTTEGAQQTILAERFWRDYERADADLPTAFDKLLADDVLPDDVLPDPEPGPSAVISSVKVETRGAHDIVRIWNRGGLAGELTVCAGDGAVLRQRLLGNS